MAVYLDVFCEQVSVLALLLHARDDLQHFLVLEQLHGGRAGDARCLSDLWVCLNVNLRDQIRSDHTHTHTHTHTHAIHVTTPIETLTPILDKLRTLTFAIDSCSLCVCHASSSYLDVMNLALEFIDHSAHDWLE